MRYFLLSCLGFLLAAQTLVAEGPLMRNFVGLNGHFHFKPELYRPTCQLVRNYHNINWDVPAPGATITFPVCANKVNWESLYSKWTDGGWEVDVCLMFGTFGPGNKAYQTLWEDQLDWAEDYGYAVAKGLSEGSLATSIEIGNEPGNEFDDALYRKIFKRMATGIRRADPKLKILTCTSHARVADKYHKSLDATFASKEIHSLFDVINVHVYSEKAEQDQAHPWEWSYPEDPSIDYLSRVQEVIAWRDDYTPGKEIWITEFGYDACSEAAMQQREGWFQKLAWTGQTELQQAQWLLRSLLCFAALEVDRAYIYFFNDKDQASVHAASGLTRNFKPKPAYWAVAQYQQLLGDYRFSRKLQEKTGDLYAYEFINEKGKLIWVLWSPTGHGRSKTVTLHRLPSSKFQVFAMVTAEGDPANVPTQTIAQGISLEVGESPVYLRFE